jgi:hypothetical protein
VGGDLRGPDDRSKECTVVKLGLQLMIKGPTEQVVKEKVEGGRAWCKADLAAFRGDRRRLGGDLRRCRSDSTSGSR